MGMTPDGMPRPLIELSGCGVYGEDLEKLLRELQSAPDRIGVLVILTRTSWRL